ncbi:hypothetical protein EMCRGX_G029157 [Ephydatia muelleri]
MESAGATHSDEGRRGETEIDNPAGASSDLADDQIFMRMRSDAMYELRKLKHQHKPVSDFEGKKLLEEHFQRFSIKKSPPSASVDGTGGDVSNRTKHFRDTEVAGRNARAPMPDAIRLEISGLFERRRVSESATPEGQLGGLVRSRLSPALTTTSGLSPANACARARDPCRRTDSIRHPVVIRRGILEQVRSSPALNSLGPEARDRVVAEIGGLVQQQLVSSALTGEFRGVLELHIQERAERLADGVGVEQMMENLHRRAEHSEAASAAHSSTSSASSLTDLKQEMIEMKAQLLEMKQLMRLSFDLQLDIQRSIRQEVAAAFSTQCQPSPASFGQPSIEGSQVNVHLVQSGHCTICSEASIDSVIYRCGHMCVCMACGMELKAQGLKCPICRAPITDLIRAYASMC